MTKKYILIFFAHLAISIIFFFFFKFEYVENWNFFWQNINEKYLFINKNLFQNIWALHSQPPLHNLFYAVILNLFYPYQHIAYKLIQAICGALLIVNIFVIIDFVIETNIINRILKLIIFFNPAVFLYEHYYLYTLNTAFILSVCLVFLIFFLKYKSQKFLLLFVFFLNILILYRSSFHFIFLILVLIFFAVILKLPKRTIIYACLISLLSFSWYLKNYVNYGFFGASSWQGLNLYKFITTNYNKTKAQQVSKKIQIPEILLNTNHFYTEIYDYKKYKFTKTANLEFLNDNNWHNINAVDIAKIHNDYALKIIMNFPKFYFANLRQAYSIYSRPSFTYAHLVNNAEKISIYTAMYNNIIYFDNYVFKAILKTDIYPINQFLFPIILIALLIFYVYSFFYKKNFSDKDKIIIFLLVLVFYYSTVSCMLELGENNRFRFTVEPYIFILFFYYIEQRA
ncbi:MAG TPA: hypothetical protein PLM75_11560, partial [bacterium]|nr:hypothetical protein [bacterium]